MPYFTLPYLSLPNFTIPCIYTLLYLIIPYLAYIYLTIPNLNLPYLNCYLTKRWHELESLFLMCSMQERWVDSEVRATGPRWERGPEPGWDRVRHPRDDGRRRTEGQVDDAHVRPESRRDPRQGRVHPALVEDVRRVRRGSGRGCSRVLGMRPSTLYTKESRRYRSN